MLKLLGMRRNIGFFVLKVALIHILFWIKYQKFTHFIENVSHLNFEICVLNQLTRWISLHMILIITHTIPHIFCIGTCWNFQNHPILTVLKSWLTALFCGAVLQNQKGTILTVQEAGEVCIWHKLILQQCSWYHFHKTIPHTVAWRVQQIFYIQSFISLKWTILS